MIRLESVGVTLEGTPVLRDVDLGVARGETLAVLGPSGSGKTTMLRVVAGLQRPDTGRVSIDGRDVSDVPSHRRGVGLVFQDAVLFPHRDVARNVAFGIPGLSRAETARRVAELLELVGLAGYERRQTGTLSGGEAQRVALARALAPSPTVLLLDEPLGSLDGPLRDRLQDDLHALFERLGLTVVHVTHDVGEAFALGRRVALLRSGSVAQVATPDELWRRPVSEWVARFLGIRNTLQEDGRVLVVRPEAVRLSPGEDGVVLSSERDGPTLRLTVRRDDGLELEAATTALDPPRPGERVRIDLDAAGVVGVTPDAGPA
jgi:thiamine transport system ATP-binding protein